MEADDLTVRASLASHGGATKGHGQGSSGTVFSDDFLIFEDATLRPDLVTYLVLKLGLSEVSDQLWR